MAIAVPRANCAVTTFSPVSREALALSCCAITNSLVGALAVKVSFVPVIGTTSTRISIEFVEKLTATTNNVSNPMNNVVLRRDEGAVWIVSTITVQVTSRAVHEGTAESANAVTAVCTKPVAVAFTLGGTAHAVAVTVIGTGSRSQT